MPLFRDYGQSYDPWFRVGRYPATTTAIFVALNVVHMFIWAFQGGNQRISELLYLNAGSGSGSVAGGQVWRLLTWAIASPVDFFAVVLLVVFFVLATQLELLMGRVRFTYFLLMVILLPALLMTTLEFTTIQGRADGILSIELAILVAFVTQYSEVRFWPGLRGWVLAGIVVAMSMLGAVSVRDYYRLLLVVTMVVLAPLLMRAFGHAAQHQWIPKLPLPASLTNANARYRPSRRTRQYRQRPQFRDPPTRQPKSKRRKRSTHLSSVPPPSPDSAQTEIDALLDKMGSGGLDSLTEAERRSLEDLSKQLRRKRDKRGK